jgi:hypothetical protein
LRQSRNTLKLQARQYDSLSPSGARTQATEADRPEILRRKSVTKTNTDKLIGQLRILHHLTNTEAQIAQTRLVQARDDSVRQELTTNAANAQERATLIAAALRELGGVPDVITPALGRATALAKAVVEQVQPLAGALFSDLALEHQLLDRARYLEALADAADHTDTRLLARRLQAAHQETVEWINSVLAQEAAGKPTAVRPTPVQIAVSRLTRVANYPARWAAARIDDAAEALARTRSRELPVKNYDDLTVDEVEAKVQKLTDSAALNALLRYEQSNKGRVGATTAIENRLMAQASNSN